MNYNFLTVFFILSIINVVFATIKSLMTINGGKLTASLISGGYFAFYNIMMQYTVADFPMWQKCLITFVCNVVGVYLVKWGEEKARKDKLWKVEATIPNQWTNAVHFDLKDIPHNYVENVGKYTLFNFYCATQKESAKVRDILSQYEVKYFVAESKSL